MNKDILCTWLGLPKTTWPPDPWTLLGLPRDAHDLGAIEECVQDRMSKLRHYQLSYPEEATEGMNRLAEAFVTLAEACSKLRAEEAAAPARPDVNGTLISKQDTTIIMQTKTDWRDEPPPVRKETASAPEVIVDDAADTAEVLTAKPFVAPARQRRGIEPTYAIQLAQESEEATRNLGTIDAVIERVEITRRLLHAWEKIGKLLRASPKKSSSKEAEPFARRLDAIAEIMNTYPAFLGHPGKPGYRIVVQARLKIPLASVRGMHEDQREALLTDWRDGQLVLLMHRKFLRRVFKSMRHRTRAGLVLHAVRAFVNDHPRWTLAGAGLAAVVVLIGGLWLAAR